jgi:hypothetical protein
MARPMPLVAPVMKAVVTWAFLIAWFQCAAWTDAAKPRKPAKRKDKLSKVLLASEISGAVSAIMEVANPRKRRENGAFGARETSAAGRLNKKHGFRNAWLIWPRHAPIRSISPGPIRLSAQAFSYRRRERPQPPSAPRPLPRRPRLGPRRARGRGCCAGACASPGEQPGRPASR